MNSLIHQGLDYPEPGPYEADHGREPQILIVNDHPDILHLLSKTLSKSGYKRVIEAKDGSDALKLLRERRIDLLITDVHMPHLDGWRLARMVRTGLFNCPASTPIIVASATFSERIAETTAREFEVNQFLSLPLEDRNVLTRAVQTLLAESNSIFKKPRLLIIEDDQDTSILAERMLRHRFDIQSVSDGQNGLETWRAQRHDLVLLDVMLPKMAGPDVLREILQDDPQQTVIIMTADGSTERCEALMLEGAVDFIPKPFHANQLRQICEIALRRSDSLISNKQFMERTHALKSAQNHYHKIADAHQRLLDNLSSVVFELDSKGNLRFLNRAWERLSHYKIQECIGRPLYDFLAPMDRSQCRASIQALSTGRKQQHEQEVRLLSKRGDTVWTEITFSLKLSLEDEVEAIFGHITDITERKLAMAQLEHLAIHDSLTGLYNRRYFEISLEHMAAGSARSAGPHALLYIDLDHFQMVNDAISHREGDIVLKKISELLASRTREADLLCRIGGDEFAILLTHTDAEQALAVAYSLVEVINSFRYRYEPLEITLGCSIGISLLDGSQTSGAIHLVQADRASFVAKNRGRNLVHIYDPADKDSDELRQGIDWAHRVRQAIHEERLELYIQPILEVISGKINHYEALLRLRSRDPAEIISPGTFIPAVEKAGQIHILDRWVIRHAIKILANEAWLENLAINLSGHAFADPDLYAYVAHELSRQGVDARRIIFEITETSSIANINKTQQMINQLQSLGCRFALDDFGTGFCSFHYLRHLPADYLKLDGSYIKNIANNALDLAMVRSMNDIAHILGKKTIAECVETPDIMQYLQDLGVDYVQGHGIGHALPLEFYSS